MGDPWAGQESVEGENRFVSIVMILDMTDILGGDPPIGSKRKGFRLYLKLGMGDPWAEHVSARGEDSSASNPEILEFCASFGADPPMGSKEKRHVYCYLKLGTGAPWAGQEMDKAELIAISNPLILSLRENFGADPPIGSE